MAAWTSFLVDQERPVEVNEDGSVTRGPVAPVVPASDRVHGLFDGWGFENDPQS